MLGTAAVLLCLLAKATAQTLTTDAKCLSGFEWMFSSVNQSPCDVAAELAGVCVGGQFNLLPLDLGYVYLGPSLANANSCRCSSVYYSLLSSCAHCQGRDYLRWSGYNTNCSTLFVTVYNQQIPVGVKVPAYAYQNVSVSDTFNITLAQSTKGVESSRPPTSGTSISGLTSKSASSTSLPSNSRSKSKTNIPAIVGGVVGGLVALGLIGALITFFVLRSKRRQNSQAYTSGSQQSPNMAFTPRTTASLIPATTSPPPGSPSRIYDPNDPTTYPSSDPSSAHGSFNMYSGPADPYRHQSPFNPNMAPNFTGNSAQNYGPPQTMPVTQNTGRPQYTGAPEL